MNARGPHRQRVPLWAIGGLLYGLAWPLGNSIHLGFLAWFTFVPLFIVLEKMHDIQVFARRVLGFFGLATAIQCWWWFAAVPMAIAPLTWAGGLVEIVLQSLPFCVLFSLKSRFGYRRALQLLVVIVPVWEWFYAQLPLAVGALHIGYSQASYVWLIQYADATGVAGISAWILLLNYVLWEVYRAFKQSLRRRQLWQFAGIGMLIFGLPLLYGTLRSQQFSYRYGSSLNVILMHTDLPAGIISEAQRLAHAQELLAQTQDALQQNPQMDLIIWPEGLIDFDWSLGGFKDSLDHVIARWETSILLGQVAYRAEEGDSIRANSAVLVGATHMDAPQRYDKVHLVPFWEGLPGYQWLQGISLVQDYHRSNGYYTPGDGARTLSMFAQTREIQVGTPLCHEQSKPNLWATMAASGADVFIQLSFESWFGQGGFETASANIARLRSIENRRALARVTNGGKTIVFDHMGREQMRHIGGAQALVTSVPAYGYASLYTRYPFGFALVCGLTAIGWALHYMRQGAL